MMRSISWAYVSQCFVHFHLDTNGVFNMQKAKRIIPAVFYLCIIFILTPKYILRQSQMLVGKTYKTNNRTNQAIATVG